MENCIFSKIAKGETDTKIIYEVTFYINYIFKYIFYDHL